MPKLSTSLRSELRLFAFWLANGTVDPSVLDPEEIDYSSIFSEPSKFESVFAIYGNVLELDESGTVLNEVKARRRAAQYIRQCIEPSYSVDPPWEGWEIELH